jgi:hypothetical protein
MLRRSVVVLIIAALSLPTIASGAGPDPILISVGLERSGPFQPGDGVGFTYEVDDVSVLSEIAFRFTDRVGRSRTEWENDPDGVVSFPVGDHWAGGAYVLEEVFMYSSEGGFSSYDRDGSSTNGGVSGTHDVDLSAADFSVVNPAEDISVPVVHSFTAQPMDNVTPGSVIRFEYDVEEQSGLEGIQVYLTDEDGRQRSAHDPDLDGVIKMEVGRYWAAGNYKLVGLFAWDAAENYADYYRDGSVEKWPQGANGPNEHSFDFSAFDFSLDNPDADEVPPVLTSFSLVDPPFAAPGEQVEIAYEAEEQSGIDRIAFGFYGPGGFFNAWDPEGDGVAVLSLDDSFDEGIYRLYSVSLTDLADNSASYYRDGYLYNYPSTGNGSDSHTFDLSSADFRVLEFEGFYEDALGRGSIKVDFGLGFFQMTLDGQTLPISQGTIQAGGSQGPLVLARDDESFPMAGIFSRDDGSFSADGVWEGSPFSLLNGP